MLQMKKYKGLKRVLHAFYNSINGLRVVFKNELAFVQELYLCILLTPLMFIIETNITEKLFLVLSMFIVLIVEIINSAIESTIDRIGLEHNALSGQAKDMGSAAVFLSLSMIIITHAVIFIPKIFCN
jgi:diacylglycerol kinase (ATP)